MTDFTHWSASAQTLVERSLDNAVELAGWTVDGANRFYWLYLLSFVALGLGLWHRHYRGNGGGWRAALGFVLPRTMYTHPSAMMDYKILLTNRILGPSGTLARLVLGSASIAGIATLVQQGLVHIAGPGLRAEWTPLMLVGFTLVFALVSDFSTYVIHALHHRYALLWEFHKVHHSAEVLTPFTVYRKHPVYNVLSRALDLALVGPFMGVIAWLFADAPVAVTLFGANFVFSLFHLLGANLRHSHIWWSFGPVLGRIFVSPAQHQIHHSKDPRHYNKNYGELFALWDWLFGTLYLPGRAPERLEFGLSGADAKIHSTLLAAYVVPFTNCGSILRDRLRRRLPARAARNALPR